MHRCVVPLLLLLAAWSLPSTAVASSRADDFEQSVPLQRTEDARAAGAWRTTAPLRAPRRFDLLGVRWRGGDARVELRVQRTSGRWSRWVEAPSAEQPPARRSGATHAAGPVWSGGGKRYQLRVTGTARAMQVHFVSVTRPPAPLTVSAAAAGRPAIVPRSAWDPGNDCPPRVTPAYGRVDFGMVHHTVSLNGYSPRDSAAIVLAICRFHRNGNGWNDIGYNLLVDRFGTVFEGRAGGVEAPVVGAQAQGWNGVSTGVAAIGDFSSATPPAVMLHAIARVLAWKLGLAGVPAKGAIGETSIGGKLNRWAEGDRVTFQRISGHRDGDATDCPGGALAARLPSLRALVAQLLPAPRDLLTISPAVAPQPPGGPVYLTGRLARADGRRPAGAAIVLQQRLDGVWNDLTSVTTGADGIWTATLPLTRNGDVRALQTDSDISSPAVPIQVRTRVTARVSARHVQVRTAIALLGATTPAKPRVRVLVERRLAANPARFRHLRIRTLATVDGRFATSLRLPAPGVYRITVLTPTDRTNAAGSSRALTLRALRGR